MFPIELKLITLINYTELKLITLMSLNSGFETVELLLPMFGLTPSIYQYVVNGLKHDTQG